MEVSTKISKKTDIPACMARKNERRGEVVCRWSWHSGMRLGDWNRDRGFLASCHEDPGHAAAGNFPLDILAHPLLPHYGQLLHRHHHPFHPAFLHPAHHVPPPQYIQLLQGAAAHPRDKRWSTPCPRLLPATSGTSPPPCQSPLQALPRTGSSSQSRWSSSIRWMRLWASLA